MVEIVSTAKHNSEWVGIAENWIGLFDYFLLYYIKC